MKTADSAINRFRINAKGRWLGIIPCGADKKADLEIENSFEPAWGQSLNQGGRGASAEWGRWFEEARITARFVTALLAAISSQIFCFLGFDLFFAPSCAVVIASFFAALDGRNFAVKRFGLFLSLIVLLAWLSYSRSANTVPPDLVRDELSRLSSGLGASRAKRTVRPRLILPVRGCVIGRPRHPRPGEISFALKAELGNAHNVKLLLSAPDVPWEKISTIGKGDCLLADVVLFPLESSSRAAAPLFSYDAHLFRQGFAARGFVRELKSLAQQHYAWSGRETFIRNLLTQYREQEALSLVLAATLGEQDLLGDEISRVFRETGTSHLVVVSGFHVGIAYSAARAAARFLLTRSELMLLFVPANLPSALVSLLFAGVFTIITGAALPTFRAFLCLVALVFGKLLGRLGNGLRILALVAIIMNMIWPGAFLELGFELTFTAVWGLLVASRVMSWIRIEGRLMRALVTSSVCCFFAWLFTSPVLLLWTNKFSAGAVLINLILIPPFTAIIICLGGVSTALCYVRVPGAEVLMEITLLAGSSLVKAMYAVHGFCQGGPLGQIELSLASSVALALGMGFFALFIALFVYSPLENLLPRRKACLNLESLPLASGRGL